MITLERLRLAIEWRRFREDDPPVPWYIKSGHAKFCVFPIKVPGLKPLRQPNLQNIPRGRRYDA